MGCAQSRRDGTEVEQYPDLALVGVAVGLRSPRPAEVPPPALIFAEPTLVDQQFGSVPDVLNDSLDASMLVVPAESVERGQLKSPAGKIRRNPSSFRPVKAIVQRCDFKVSPVRNGGVGKAEATQSEMGQWDRTASDDASAPQSLQDAIASSQTTKGASGSRPRMAPLGKPPPVLKPTGCLSPPTAASSIRRRVRGGTGAAVRTAPVAIPAEPVEATVTNPPANQRSPREREIGMVSFTGSADDQASTRSGAATPEASGLTADLEALMTAEMQLLDSGKKLLDEMGSPLARVRGQHNINQAAATTLAPPDSPVHYNIGSIDGGTQPRKKRNAQRYDQVLPELKIKPGFDLPDAPRRRAVLAPLRNTNANGKLSSLTLNHQELGSASMGKLAMQGSGTTTMRQKSGRRSTDSSEDENQSQRRRRRRPNPAENVVQLWNDGENCTSSTVGVGSEDRPVIPAPMMTNSSFSKFLEEQTEMLMIR